MAGRRPRARALLGLFRPRHLRGGAGAHLPRRDLEFPLPRGRAARARQLPPLEPRRDAGGGDPRQGGRAARLRESLRAPRLAARAQRERRGPQTSSASITTGATISPATSPASRSARASAARAACRRSAGRTTHAPAQAARRDARRASSSARCRRTRRRSSNIWEPEIVGAHPSRDAGAGEAPRRLQPGAAEQLEALHGEREGHLPREPAAHVLHHLPDQPPVAERRHRRQR